MTTVFGAGQLDAIQAILADDLIDVGVHSALLIDMAGNIIATLDNGSSTHDIYALAALSAGNFGAVSSIAKILGEDSFSLLFHKGEKEHIHFSRVTEDFLLITIFGNTLSLGYLRLKVSQALDKLGTILEKTTPE